MCQSRLKVKRDREQILTSGVFFYFQRLLSAARSRLRIKRVLFGIDRPGNGGGRQHLNSGHLRIDQNHPVTCGITRKTAKSRRPPAALILKIGSWILNTWLNQDFEYSAQSRFWILLFGPDLTWRLEIGGWGIGRGEEGFGLCSSRGACGPLGGFQSQTSGQEQADYTTFNPTSSSTSC